MATVPELQQALEAADAAGNVEDATELADEIFLRSRRAEEGQPSTEVGPLGNGAEAGPTADPFDLPFDEGAADGGGGLFDDDGAGDPLSTVSKEVAGIALPTQLRERMLSARGIEDPREQRLETVRIGAQMQALKLAGEDEEGTGASKGMTLLRGIGAGQFGLGDLAAAAGTFLGTDLDFEESIEYEREFRRALEEQHPGFAIGGEIIGAITGGAAALKGVTALAKGTKAAPLVKKATVFTKGGGAKGFAKNALRASVAGGTAAGITEGITEGEPGTGVAIGVAAGPVGVGAIKLASITGPMIKRFMDDPATKGIRVLAKKLGETQEELSKRFLEFQMVLGRVPSLADIADLRSVTEVRKLIAERTGAIDIAREQAEATVKRRPGEVAEAVTGGRVTTTVTKQKAARDKIAEKQFKAAEADDIEFAPSQVQDLLADPDLRRGIPPTLKRRMDEAMDVPEGTPVTLSGLDVNDLRKALRSRGKGAVGADRIFNELADEVEDVARAQSEKFGLAIDEFAMRSRRIEALQAGRKVGALKTTAEFEEASRLIEEGNVAAGRRVGARTELTETARESATKAAALAKDLSAEGGLVKRLRSVMSEEEVDRLVEVGRLVSRSAENIGILAPAVKAEQSKLVDETVRALAGAGVIAAGRGSGGFISNFIRGAIDLITPRTSRKVVESLARDVLDPAKTQKVIAALRRAGLKDEDLLDLFATSVAAGTLAAAQ